MNLVTRAEILTALNTRLGRSESNVTDYINATLSEISCAALWPVLHTSETTAVTSGTTTVDDPSDLRVLDFVSLLEGGVVRARLHPITWESYQRQLVDMTSAEYNEPQYFVRRGGKLYLWPIPDGAYSVKVFYWKHYGEGDTILFDSRFREALYNGTMFHYLEGIGLDADPKTAQVRDKYNRAMDKLMNDADTPVDIAEYHDPYTRFGRHEYDRL